MPCIQHFLTIFYIHLSMPGLRDLSAIQVKNLARLLAATMRQ